MNDKFFQSARIYLKYLAWAMLGAAAVFIIGETLAQGQTMIWLFRLGAAGILLFGLTNWNRPIVPKLLEGPQYRYYPVFSYNNTPVRLIQAGNRLMRPSEYVNEAQAIDLTLPIIEIEYKRTAYNRTFDTFD
ncbi:MAG: hypothetical protein L0154_16325, partial [Chloroflexi bacterium]|nr:hypothetical protein [Chloroflexota bacterium]